MTRGFRDAMADGLVTQEELSGLRDLADLWGVELPASLGYMVEAFNILEEKGIDPSTASVEELNDAMREASGWITKLDGSIVNVSLNINGGPLPSAGENFGWSQSAAANLLGGASAFSQGEEATSGDMRQHGGRLGGGPTLVGEAGPELIVDGVVVPADMTRRLLQLGLAPGRRMTHGGAVYGSEPGPAAAVKYPVYAPSPNEPGGDPDIGWSTGGGGGGGGGTSGAAARAVAVAVAVQASLPPAIEAAAQAATAASTQQMETISAQLQDKFSQLARKTDETNAKLGQLIEAVLTRASDTGISTALMKTDFRG